MYNRVRSTAPLLILILLLLLPTTSLAQLSCEHPPPPFDSEDVLANWQTVWNLMDVCQGKAGVFGEIISGGVYAGWHSAARQSAV